MEFAKYHALGNDYLVVEGVQWEEILQPARIRTVCHRHFGLGSDGILVNVPTNNGFHLRIFNPDGSEAEKSGNGLRIYARYLYDTGRVSEAPFGVLTAGGQVTCQILDGGKFVTVEMGKVRFLSTAIPVVGPEREVIGESLKALDRTFIFTAATVGNPHCVVLVDDLSRDDIARYGPEIESHPLFPSRTNVQFVKVIDRRRIKIEIWERGAGYTLASGSSSSASAAVAFRLGLVDGDVTVEMPGGELSIKISDDYAITMKGPVTRVASGQLSPECLQ